MNEKYRLSSRDDFNGLGRHILTTVLAAIILFAAIVGLAMLSIETGLDLTAVSYIIIITVVVWAIAGSFRWGEFIAEDDRVTFKVFLKKRTFLYSDIDDIGVETKLVVRHHKRRTERFFAEMITITSHGKKSRFYARMDFNVRFEYERLRTERTREILQNGGGDVPYDKLYGVPKVLKENMSEEQLQGITALSMRQRLNIQKEISQDDMHEQQLEHSRFLRLKRFIEENKY